MSLLKKSDSFATAMTSKLIPPEEIMDWAEGLRVQGKKIATLNGSFDLLHAGHLEMIYQASSQADVLLVALNTDRSIQGYKSPSRPIVSLTYRLQMMAALEMVDFVTWFDELDPRELLKKIRPDVHVNGAEYTEASIEADVVKGGGGRIHIVPLLPGLSTTEIIHKIVTTCV